MFCFTFPRPCNARLKLSDLRLNEQRPREDRGIHCRVFDSEVSGRDYALRPGTLRGGGRPEFPSPVPRA